MAYKNHINADKEHKLVQSYYALTSASIHDSQVFYELLDKSQDSESNERAVYVDSAYSSYVHE